MPRGCKNLLKCLRAENEIDDGVAGVFLETLWGCDGSVGCGVRKRVLYTPWNPNIRRGLVLEWEGVVCSNGSFLFKLRVGL